MATEKLALARALNESLRTALESDPKVLIMGEDVGKLGGVFRVTDGLQKDFGEDRVIDTPLAESGIVGTAIGLALRGYRPVVEIQFDGFVFPAYDQIVTQLAKMHARSLGTVKLPIVIRIPYGGGIGGVHAGAMMPFYGVSTRHLAKVFPRAVYHVGVRGHTAVDFACLPRSFRDKLIHLHVGGDPVV